MAQNEIRKLDCTVGFSEEIIKYVTKIKISFTPYDITGADRFFTAEDYAGEAVIIGPAENEEAYRAYMAGKPFDLWGCELRYAGKANSFHVPFRTYLRYLKDPFAARVTGCTLYFERATPLSAAAVATIENATGLTRRVSSARTYVIIAAVLVCMLCAFVEFVLYRLYLRRNNERYIAYKTVGANNLTVAAAGIFDSLLFLIVGLALGAGVDYALGKNLTIANRTILMTGWKLGAMLGITAAVLIVTFVVDVLRIALMTPMRLREKNSEKQ